MAPEMRGALPPAAPRPTATNYGEPRPKERLPKPYPPLRTHAGEPKRFKNPLPPLEPYKTSAVARRALRLRPSLQDPAIAAAKPTAEPPPTVAAVPTLKVKAKPKPDVDPYAPVGIGVGSMRLSPFIETSGGYDTNPNRLPVNTNPTIPSNNTNTPVPSSFARVDTGLRLRTDWAKDDLQADLRLGYVDYFDNQPASRPDGVGNVVGRYDVTRDTAIDVLGRFSLDTQRPGSPAISSNLPNVTVTNRPIVAGAGASLGVTQKFGRLDISLRGSFDRYFYQNATYSDGSTLDLASTDYNDYGVTGIVAYELSPYIKPFVQATYDSRVHDAWLDPYGYARDSVGVAARGGVRVRFSELLNGEASGGYAEREYRDPRLPLLATPTLDGSLIYTPSALTTLTLRAATTLNETTLEGSSGTITHSLGAELAHDLMRNLRISLLGTYYQNNYVVNSYYGPSIVERGYTAGAKLEYKITRWAALKFSYSHERLVSSAANSSYQADVFMAGVRVQP